jgi:ribosomal protein L11 methyltransferase
MSWLQVQVNLGKLPPATVEETLLEIGAESIELTDGGNNPILEPGPGATPLWETTRITALFQSDVDTTKVRLAIAAAVSPAPLPPIQITVVEDQDWVALWQESLRPMLFGEKLWICPRSQKCPDPNGDIVILEPGLAFGSGTHPTTSLCLDWIATHDLAGLRILDFGCGSGILAIAGIACGARHATAVDADEQAIKATNANSTDNGCGAHIDVLRADCLAAGEPYDVIIANILSGTLIELEPLLRAHSHSGTRLVLSGVLASQGNDVENAYRAWASFEPPKMIEDWLLLSATVN